MTGSNYQATGATSTKLCLPVSSEGVKYCASIHNPASGGWRSMNIIGRYVQEASVKGKTVSPNRLLPIPMISSGDYLLLLSYGEAQHVRQNARLSCCARAG
jgi:hypothetical protein